ncbi:hypothetical protein [Streptomyces cellostaticus]|uniref:hypothetical protein n=1 Tax=Streptomyces cellostaticus TaxID=67285 RepID=UPI002026147A|nr:hypothetical protein [Streptomyces cellostaticus]
MKFIIATPSGRYADACRSVLGDLPGVEVRMGSGPETGWDCDAAILNSPLAHERYGSSPENGKVQILVNRRDDGVPGIILTVPPTGMDSAVTDPGGAALEEWVLRSMEVCVSEFATAFPELTEKAAILVHLEGAGFDNVEIDAPLRGLRRFFDHSQQL